MQTNNTLNAGDKITFKGREYTVEGVLNVSESLTASIGVVGQYGIKGAKGAFRFLQVFANGTRRTINMTGGSVEIELAA